MMTDGSYDPRGLALYIPCTALRQIPAELNQTVEQILHRHSAPYAFPEYTKKNQLGL